MRWNLGQYQLYHNLYYGQVIRCPEGTVHPDPDHGGEYLSTYLSRYPMETAAEFEERRKRSFYLPFAREVVRRMVDALFHQEVTRGELEDAFPEGHLENVDGQGHGVRWFLKHKVATLSEVYGWCFVVTDAPKDDGKPATRYHGLPQLYARALPPQRLWDWRIDPVTAEFTYALVWEGKERWKAWYPDKYVLLDAEGNVEGPFEHTFKSVPIDVAVGEPIESDDPLSPLGASALGNGVDRLALHVYDMCSLLEGHERKALFTFLHIDAAPATQESKAAQRDVPLGESHFFYKKGKVGWVEPPPSVPKEAREQIVWAVVNMFRAAGLDQLHDQGKEAKSGVALAIEYSDRRAAVVRRGEEMEDFEGRLWGRQGKILGITVPPKPARYPRDYAVAPVAEELAEMQRLVDLHGGYSQLPPPARALYWLKFKRVALRDSGHQTEIGPILEAAAELADPNHEPDESPAGRKPPIESRAGDKPHPGLAPASRIAGALDGEVREADA